MGGAGRAGSAPRTGGETDVRHPSPRLDPAHAPPDRPRRRRAGDDRGCHRHHVNIHEPARSRGPGAADPNGGATRPRVTGPRCLCRPGPGGRRAAASPRDRRSRRVRTGGGRLPQRPGRRAGEPARFDRHRQPVPGSPPVRRGAGDRPPRPEPESVERQRAWHHRRRPDGIGALRRGPGHGPAHGGPPARSRLVQPGELPARAARDLPGRSPRCSWRWALPDRPARTPSTSGCSWATCSSRPATCHRRARRTCAPWPGCPTTTWRWRAWRGWRRQGDLPAAIDLYQRAKARLPLPEIVVGWARHWKGRPDRSRQG